MGFEHFRRPVRSVFGNSTVESITVSSAAAFQGNITLSADLKLPAESLTNTASAQTLTDHGVSFLTIATSGAGGDFKLPNPPGAGAVKYVFVSNNTTSIDSHIVTAASSRTFWGTTYNDASLSAASTGSPGGTPAGTVMLGLIGASTSQWAVFPGSTFNWDFTASTGTTG